MPVTVRGTDILFNDNTTQGTAAGAPTTAQVLAATAAASVGAVGSYAFLVRPSNTGTTTGNARNPGATLAGSSLRFSNAQRTTSTTPAGTWRCMGFMAAFVRSAPYGGALTDYGETNWLRIS